MSTYPNIVAGMSLTSALLQAMLPVDGYKSGDQSVTSSTTLVNDSALVVPVSPVAVYHVEALIYYLGTTHATADIKFNFTFPSGATSAGVSYLGQSTALAVQQGQVALGGALTFGTNGTGNVMVAKLEFTLTTSISGGSLQLQWAQNTSNATATTVKAGSLLTAKRKA